jgi:hypothetical protein
MKAIRSCVFGSRAERESFGHLLEQWAKRANVYHNLPFLQVFDLEKLTALLKLDRIQSSRLKKTSLDFVICDKKDQPLVAIDFDGLNQGFNIGTSYRGPNGWRKQMFELKLRIADSCQFPYLIVRSAQLRFLPGKSKLTVIDGVIGSVLAHMKTVEDWRKVDFKEMIPNLEKLSTAERLEAAQDLLLQIETVAQIESCPITARRWELFKELDINGYEFSPLESDGAYGIRARVRKGDAQASAKVWIPAFGGCKIDEFTLVENLALLVAAEKLASKMAAESTED